MALVIAGKLLGNAAEFGGRDAKYRSFGASNPRISRDCLSAAKAADLLKLGGFRRADGDAADAGWHFPENGDTRRARAIAARCASSAHSWRKSWRAVSAVAVVMREQRTNDQAAHLAADSSATSHADYRQGSLCS